MLTVGADFSLGHNHERRALAHHSTDTLRVHHRTLERLVTRLHLVAQVLALFIHADKTVKTVKVRLTADILPGYACNHWVTRFALWAQA